MDRHHYSLSQQFRQPGEEGRTFCVNMNHIVSSKSTAKCRKSGGTHCRKSLCVDGRDRFLTDTLILHRLVILCAAHMMAATVEAGHFISVSCHSSTKLFDDDLYAALSRQSLLSEHCNCKFFVHTVSSQPPHMIGSTVNHSKHLSQITQIADRFLHLSAARYLTTSAPCSVLR